MYHYNSEGREGQRRRGRTGAGEKKKQGKAGQMRGSRIMKEGGNRRRGKTREGKGNERKQKRGGNVKPEGKTGLSRNIC